MWYDGGGDECGDGGCGMMVEVMSVVMGMEMGVVTLVEVMVGVALRVLMGIVMVVDHGGCDGGDGRECGIDGGGGQ